MGLPEHYAPCPIEWMKHHNTRFTICEVLRKIYDATEDESIRVLARVAMNMAKRMNNKLMEYNPTWQEMFNAPTPKTKSQIGG